MTLQKELYSGTIEMIPPKGELYKFQSQKHNLDIYLITVSNLVEISTNT